MKNQIKEQATKLADNKTMKNQIKEQATKLAEQAKQLAKKRLKEAEDGAVNIFPPLTGELVALCPLYASDDELRELSTDDEVWGDTLNEFGIDLDVDGRVAFGQYIRSNIRVLLDPEEDEPDIPITEKTIARAQAKGYQFLYCVSENPEFGPQVEQLYIASKIKLGGSAKEVTAADIVAAAEG